MKTTNIVSKVIRIVVVLAVFAAICLIIFQPGSSAQAGEDEHVCKMYTSIRLEEGDTLWSIAERYMDGHYSSIHAYIDELKTINELTSDIIHADAYLVVPYYTQAQASNA